MDEFLRVPGTKFRFGLDPLIGLIPGVGDTGSAFVSAFALIQAARSGLPKILLARMSLNILINELIGIIPGVGDAFSFWFKSNARNYRHSSRARHWDAGRRERAIGFLSSAFWCCSFSSSAAGIAVSIFILHELLRFLRRSLRLRCSTFVDGVNRFVALREALHKCFKFLVAEPAREPALLEFSDGQVETLLFSQRRKADSQRRRKS